MWTEVKSEPDQEAARKWKELFEDEGVPTRVLPKAALTGGKDAGYSVLVPNDKVHIIREVLRKL